MGKETLLQKWVKYNEDTSTRYGGAELHEMLDGLLFECYDNEDKLKTLLQYLPNKEEFFKRISQVLNSSHLDENKDFIPRKSNIAGKETILKLAKEELEERKELAAQIIKETGAGAYVLHKLNKTEIEYVEDTAKIIRLIYNEYGTDLLHSLVGFYQEFDLDYKRKEAMRYFPNILSNLCEAYSLSCHIFLSSTSLKFSMVRRLYFARQDIKSVKKEKEFWHERVRQCFV